MSSHVAATPDQSSVTRDAEALADLHKAARRKSHRDLESMREILERHGSDIIHMEDHENRKLYDHICYRYLDADVKFITLLLYNDTQQSAEHVTVRSLIEACKRGWVETATAMVSRLQASHNSCEDDRASSKDSMNLSEIFGEAVHLTLRHKYLAKTVTKQMEFLGLGPPTTRYSDVKIDGKGVHEAGRETRNYEAIISCLIDAGASLEMGERNGKTRTALHKACLAGDSRMCELLLRRGAKVECPDLDGGESVLATPLHYACLSANLACVQSLLAAGSNINARDKCEQTPLHYVFLTRAKLRENAAIAKVLMDKGADIFAVAQEGWTPFSCMLEVNSRSPRRTGILEEMLKMNLGFPVFHIIDHTMWQKLKYTWVSVQKLVLLYQAGLDDDKCTLLSKFCTTYYTTCVLYRPSLCFSVGQSLLPLKVITEFASWIAPDQNEMTANVHKFCRPEEKSYFKTVSSFSSLKKWSISAIRRHLFHARQRSSILPVIDKLQGELPASLLPLIRLTGPTENILSIVRTRIDGDD